MPFYKCAGACTLELDDLTRALNAMRFDAGKDFDVIVVSIDFNETFTLAQAKKRDYLDSYKRPGADKGWHFLTGSEDFYPETRRFSRICVHAGSGHQAVVTPHRPDVPHAGREGFALSVRPAYAPRDVKLALVDASDHKIGSLSEYAALLAHIRMRRGNTASPSIESSRSAAGGTILIMTIFILTMFRMERKRAAKLPGGISDEIADSGLEVHGDVSMNSNNFPLLPDQASTFAEQIDPIFWVLTALTVFFTVVVLFVLTVLAIRFRRGSKANRKNAAHHNLAVELAWSLPPLFLGLAVFAWSVKPYAEVYNPPKNAEEIFVVGKQWMWHIQHATNGIREMNELHVPMGDPSSSRSSHRT